MHDQLRLRRLGGLFLTLGGIGFLASGLLHPHGRGAESFHEAMVTMLSHPRWPLAHWIGLVAGLTLVWALLLLVDSGWTKGSAAAHAGARLATLGTFFMSVQWAVEIAARSALDVVSRGEPAPIAALVDAMQAVGWPALGLGFAMLAAFGRASTPKAVGIIGAIGAVAVGLAGLLAQGLHIIEAGVLFLGGHLLGLWMIWAGARAFLGPAPAGSDD